MAKNNNSRGAARYQAEQKGLSAKAWALIATLIALVVAGAILLLVFLLGRQELSPGIAYEYNEEYGGYEIYATDKSITEALIPEEIDGIPVVALRQNAFYGCEKLAVISLPDTLVHIGKGALSGISNEAYTEHNNVAKYLGNEDNPFLVLITVRDLEDVQYFVTEAGTKFIYDGALADLKHIVSVTLTAVNEIGNSAFLNCTSLQDAAIPAEVKRVGDYAFAGCTAMLEASFYGENTYIGAYSFYGCKNLTKVNLPYGVTEIPEGAFKSTSLQTLSLPDTVVKIGASAFEGSTYIRDITFPSSLEIIDSYAFKDCPVIYSGMESNIKELRLPAGLKHIGAYAFSGCDAINLVNINASVKSIGKGAFSECAGIKTFKLNAGSPITALPAEILAGCESLVYVDLPQTVSEIGDNAFAYCKSLQAIPEDLPLVKIGAGAFGGCNLLVAVRVPDTVKTIGTSAFESCVNLVSVTLPAELEAIPYRAFYGCEKLTTVTVPAGVEYIGALAFENCKGLTRVNFAEGAVLSEIDYGAFSGCAALTTPTFPDTLFYLGAIDANNLDYGDAVYSVFKGCELVTYNYDGDGGKYLGTASNPYQILVGTDGTGATEITVNAATRAIASGALYSATAVSAVTLPSGLALIGDYAFYLSGVSALNIPDTVNRIDTSAFARMSKLTSVTLPSGITHLSDMLFYNCTALTEITIPAGVTTLGTYVFESCTALTSVTLPVGIKSIPDGTFCNCAALENIDIANVGEIGYEAFSGCEELTYTKEGGALYLGTAENPYLALVSFESGAAALIESFTVKAQTKMILPAAFYGCGAMKSVTLHDGVSFIGQSAFVNCTGLTEVTLPAGIKSLSMGIFSGCSALTKVTATGVSEIGAGAFYGCGALTTLTLGEITLVDYMAFADCASIEVLDLPKVKSIGQMAFSGCTALRRLAVGKDVQTIGAYAFDRCAMLENLTIDIEYKTAGFDADCFTQYTTQSSGNLTVIKPKWGA